MNQKVTMKEIPSADRPYEKCEKLGAGALSDTELLAVLLSRVRHREFSSIAQY